MSDTSEKEKLRKEYAWLSGYGLSDQTLDDLNTLIVRATIGSDTLDVFFAKLKTLLSSDYDESELKTIVSLIVDNSFASAQGAIDGLEVWAKSLGIDYLKKSSANDEDEDGDGNSEKVDLTEMGAQAILASGSEAVAGSNQPLPRVGVSDNLADSAGSHMAFSMSDEKEIQSIKIPDSGERVDWPLQATAIIERLGLQESDPVMIRRLENIVTARLKDIRDDLETSDALTRSRKVGGMEFSDSQAERLLSLINNHDSSKINRDRQIPTVVKKTKPAATSPKIEMEDGLPVVRLPDDLMVKPEFMDEEELEEELILQQLKENASNVKINEADGEREHQGQNEIAGDGADIEKSSVSRLEKSGDSAPQAIAPRPEPFLISKKLPQVANFKNLAKPNLDGIKVVRTVMGPIDELEAMTLIEFRRLSPDPLQATEKIKEDIDTLSKEGFDRRSEAISAWHRSEVGRFYRLLGQAAMSENKSIDIVISERLASGKPTLSMDEFEAVMELNKTLRF